MTILRYGLSGPFETLSEKQIRQQMEINFFGLIDVTRKAMEVMREGKSGGVIQQVTSIGGQIGKLEFRSLHAQSKNKMLNSYRGSHVQHLLRK
jgi:short-subunit dehydrogenase